jgi:hypothetical protein
MCDKRSTKKHCTWIAICAIFSILTACSGGGDEFSVTCGGHSCIDNSVPVDSGVRYSMYQCEIYYVSGSGWQKCGYNGTPGASIRVDGFIDIDACYDMVATLEIVDPYIFNISSEDQWRGYATLLWCE